MCLPIYTLHIDFRKQMLNTFIKLFFDCNLNVGAVDNSYTQTHINTPYLDSIFQYRIKFYDRLQHFLLLFNGRQLSFVRFVTKMQCRSLRFGLPAFMSKWQIIRAIIMNYRNAMNKKYDPIKPTTPTKIPVCRMCTMKFTLRSKMPSTQRNGQIWLQTQSNEEDGWYVQVTFYIFLRFCWLMCNFHEYSTW